MDRISRLLAFTASMALMASVANADSISPDSYSDTLKVGESVTITKRVTVDAGTPTTSKVDVFFLSDTTGSMGGVIDAVRANASTILTNTVGLGDVAWGVGEYKDFYEGYEGEFWGGFGDFPWRLNQAITTDTGAVQDGIDAWAASGGADTPESNLYALSQAASDDPAVGWRDGAARIIVWFGDAVGHDPDTTPGYPGPDLATTIATLTGAGATVIGVNSGNLDGTGQASAIAAATGGLYEDTFDPTTIVDLIQDAIETVFNTYNTVSLQPVGNLPGVGVAIAPVSYIGDYDRSVARTFDFEVTFTGLVPGDHHFVINALVDGGVVATEKDHITVPGTIPLPAAGWLLLGGLGALGAISRRRRAAA
jgi:hypothetical protein